MREERLRAMTELRGALELSSWRGRSGRRYVVGIHPLSESEILDVTDAVVLAVSRDGEGTAHLIDVAAAGVQVRPSSRRSWMKKARERGATELHVHRLANGEAERAAIISDLREERPRDLAPALPSAGPGQGR